LSQANIYRPHQLLGFLFCLGLCVITSSIGALASVGARTFYANLVRPAWAPPGWLFAPVWSTLFLLMAVAAWLVWREPQTSRTRLLGLWLFVFQLIANATWSWLFFAYYQGEAAFLDVLLLWGLIFLTSLTFWRVKPLAAILLIPYLSWVAFAAVLNYTLWKMNPMVLG
jgi:benzodiazapine receptor